MEGKFLFYFLLNNFSYYADCRVCTKGEKRKEELSKKNNQFTYEAISKSQVYEENKDNKEFVDFLEFMKNEF